MPSRRSFTPASGPPLTACRLRFAILASLADKPGSTARAAPHRIRKGQIRKKLHKIASQDATLRTSNRRLPRKNGRMPIPTADCVAWMPRAAPATGGCQAKTGTMPVFRV
jgi:hypothetical protein